MSGWPITLALGAGGVKSLLLAGLGALGSSPPTGGGAAALSPRRTLVPVNVSGYAGRDFPALSVAADDAFGIDLGVALDTGDTLDASTLQLVFFPVSGGGPNFTAAIDGAARLAGTVAVQAIGRPPAGRYLFGFTCGTANGRRVAIHSFFNAVGLPDGAH